MSDYRYAVDPAFDDNSEWVTCDTCEREYDRKEYSSDTCVECENKLSVAYVVRLNGKGKGSIEYLTPEEVEREGK
jgi:hypothetical protein